MNKDDIFYQMCISVFIINEEFTFFNRETFQIIAKYGCISKSNPKSQVITFFVHS